MILTIVVPTLTLFLSFLLGKIILSKSSIDLPDFSKLFFSFALGILLLSIIAYFGALIFGFPNGIIIGQLVIYIFIFIWSTFHNPFKDIPHLFLALLKNRLLILLLVGFTPIIYILFSTHIIPEIQGNLFTGESTYGDLPFHLSTISQIAFGYQFPPDNPMYAGIRLVYPYLINFFSAILVYEGFSLRDSVMIPGIILSLSFIVLVFDFAYIITKKSSTAFLTTLLYFFNGGVGFYYFLKDYSFNPGLIFQALLHPSQLIEYSHLFSENIQWANLLTRMLVPERSILFGIPAGIIILRFLIFRGTKKFLNIWDVILSALLASFMPILHTHTVIVFFIILPILMIYTLYKDRSKEKIKMYVIFILATILLTTIHIPAFLSQLAQSSHFMSFHFGWMTNPNESFFLFWFKNGYLLIPFSIAVLFIPKINSQVKILQLCAFALFVLMNLVLFSPYNWDNIKFLLWIGLFFSLGAAEILQLLFVKRFLLLKILCVIIIISMISSASLSFIREINVQYELFSSDAIQVSNFVQKSTPKDALFLTYPVHNSPISNLGGRQIMMGYPGLLWTHGINYSQRQSDITEIFEGDSHAKQLLKQYNISYVVLETNDPDGITINRPFFTQFAIVLQSGNYTIYHIPKQ